MTDHATEEVIAELDDVLEAEREALLTGNLDVIGRLLNQKERLVDELAQGEAEDAHCLKAMAEKLRRNQELLVHAMEGIKTVATRLSTLRRVQDVLDTYDSKGVRRSVEITQTGSVEKRA